MPKSSPFRCSFTPLISSPVHKGSQTNASSGVHGFVVFFKKLHLPSGMDKVSYKWDFFLNDCQAKSQNVTFKSGVCMLTHGGLPCFFLGCGFWPPHGTCNSICRFVSQPNANSALNPGESLPAAKSTSDEHPLFGDRSCSIGTVSTVFFCLLKRTRTYVYKGSVKYFFISQTLCFRTTFLFPSVRFNGVLFVNLKSDTFFSANVESAIFNT